MDRNKSAGYETRFISDIFDGTITINLIFPVSPLFSGKLEVKQNPNTIDILEKFESVCMCAAASDGDKIAQQDDECETTTENLQERRVDTATEHAIYILLQLLQCKSKSCRRHCEWIDAIQGLSASTLQVLSCLHGNESGNQKTAGLTDQRGLTHVFAALLLFGIALPLLVS